MTDTQYTQVSNDYQEGYHVEGYDDDPWSGGWSAGYGDIVTLVEGDLANRVLARVGKSEGRVEIVEHHWDSGYCITCSYEETDFLVRVDGEEVYRTRDYMLDTIVKGEYIEPQATSLTSFGVFNEWLNGTDN